MASTPPAKGLTQKPKVWHPDLARLATGGPWQGVERDAAASLGVAGSPVVQQETRNCCIIQTKMVSPAYGSQGSEELHAHSQAGLLSGVRPETVPGT